MAKPTKSTSTPTGKSPKPPIKMVSKPAPRPRSKASAKPILVSATTPVVTGPELKKKELIDLVVARSGVKKKEAKPVVEAMLAVLGETIASGRELNLQPFGKLRINRVTDKGNGNVIICKLRQSKSAIDKANEGLAAPRDKL